MSFRVEITTPAEKDVREILAYIANRSLSGAAAWRDAFESTLLGLGINPLVASVAPEDALFGESIRQALFKTKSGRVYRAVFVIRDETVHLLRVRCPGQDLLDLDELHPPRKDERERG